MHKKEQARFDAWWSSWLKNRAKLITIYNNEIDLNLATMEIAEAAWEGRCREAETKTDQERKAETI